MRNQSKMSSRYLWSQEDMIGGEEEVIWGFLDDVWHWSKNKLSPNDPASLSANLLSAKRRPPRPPSSISRSITPSMAKENFESTGNHSVCTSNEFKMPYAKVPSSGLNSLQNSISGVQDMPKKECSHPLSQDSSYFSKPENCVPFCDQSHYFSNSSSQTASHTKTNCFSLSRTSKSREANSRRSSNSRIRSYQSNRPVRKMVDPKDLDQKSILNHSYKKRYQSRSPSHTAATPRIKNAFNGSKGATPSKLDSISFTKHSPCKQTPKANSRNNINTSHYSSTKTATGLLPISATPRHKVDFSRGREASFRELQKAYLSEKSGSTSQMTQRGKIPTSEYYISDQSEKATRDWLLQLRLNARLVQESLGMLKNPLRNGVLLCELICMLETESNDADCSEEQASKLLETRRAIEAHFYRVNYRPKNAEEMRKNIELAFEVLKARYPLQLSGDQEYGLEQHQEKNSKYARMLKLIVTDECTPDYIIRGERDAIWSILNTLRLFYNAEIQLDISSQRRSRSPNKIPISSQTVSLVAARASLHLPYSTLDLRRLELSILNWLFKDLGVIQPPNANCSFTTTSFSEWANQLRNGTLLVDAVQQTLQIKIAGTFKQPRSDATAMSNIRKALAVLRRQPRMSQKFMWNERQVFNGDEGIVLGLFQDLHRLYCGLPPRRGTTDSDYFKDGPFLGGINDIQTSESQYSSILYKLPLQAQSEIKRKPERVFESFGNNHTEQIQYETKILSPQENRKVMIVEETKQSVPDALTAYLSVSSISEAKPPPPPAFLKACAFSPPQSSVCSNDYESRQGQSDYIQECKIQPQAYPLRPQPQQNQKVYPRQNKPSEMTFEGKKDLKITEETQESQPGGYRRVCLDTEGSTAPHFTEIQNDDQNVPPTDSTHKQDFISYTTLATGCQQSIVDYKELEMLKNWVLSVPGLDLDSTFDLASSVVPEFSSGVLLCDLVSKLELKDIQGICRHPKSSASALHNIRKALQVLKFKPTVPIYLIYSQNEIFRGDPSTIVGLLKAMRLAYKNIRFPQKKLRFKDTKESTLASKSSIRMR